MNEPNSKLPSLAELPVAGVLGEAVAASRGGAAVVTAPPGSGKTLLVPAAVLDDLPAPMQVLLVQPRRLAARAVAHTIARLRGGELGAEVGYQVRLDSCLSRDTRLIVATTGILLRRLLDDIALERFGAVVLDEFHERTLEMDLALGMLVRLRQTLRPDLRIVVMSATLAAEPVARALGGCPVISAEGRTYPVDVRYLRRGAPRELEEQVVDAVDQAVRQSPGHVLAFLPGVGEIRQCQRALEPLAARHECELAPLYGELSLPQQERALAEVGRRKIVLATNVAETSLTIPGVTAVVDSGLARQMRVAAATGLPRLELVPISQASADQRAGRAGRTAPGVCWRLWTEAAHNARPAAETPEALRGDLAGPLLALLAWGEARDFPWLDAPPAEALAQAQRQLQWLGAVDDRQRITPLGQQLARLPAHPRLARLLLAGAEQGVLAEAALAAALLSDRDPFRVGPHESRGPRDYGGVRSRSDVVDRVAALAAFRAAGRSDDAHWPLHEGAARHVLRAADQLARLAGDAPAAAVDDADAALRRALLAAFPDRLARLRAGSQDRGLLVGGRGVRIDGRSRVRGEPLFLAIDVDDGGGEVRARVVSAVEREWLVGPPLRTTEELLYNPTRRQVEARLRTYWIDLLIDETPAAIADWDAAAELLARHARDELDRVLPAADSAAGQFWRRAAWVAAATPELGWPALSREAVAERLAELCRGLRSIDELRQADWLSWLQRLTGVERVREIDRLAPADVPLPSGNRGAILYDWDQPPTLAVKIQELFGLAETPRIAGGRHALRLQLLGPNGRPQQVTTDLASFWQNTYPQVQKELRRRYPKHHWPDDPASAAASRSGLKRHAGP